MLNPEIEHRINTLSLAIRYAIRELRDQSLEHAASAEEDNEVEQMQESVDCTDAARILQQHLNSLDLDTVRISPLGGLIYTEPQF